MDMMRPVVLAYPPVAPEALSFNPSTGELLWNDNSIAETAYSFQMRGDATTWREVVRIERNLADLNTTGQFTTTLPTSSPTPDTYVRIVAENKVGDWWDYGQPAGLNEGSVFPTATAKSASAELAIVRP
jgi:hypothetical protein